MNPEQIYRNIATLLDAGMDIHRTFRQSVSGTKDKYRRAFLAVSKRVQQGSTLAEAIRLYPTIFPLFDAGIIETGELAGQLPQSFKALADWYAFRARIYNRIMSNLWYPLFLIHAAPVIMNLPGLVSGMSPGRYVTIIVCTYLFFYMPCGIIIYANHRSQTSESLKQITDRVLGAVPVLGDALYNLGLARFSHVFWAVYKTGMPMENCMVLATKNCGNTMVKVLVETGIRNVRNGLPASTGFSKRLPNDFITSWAVGEESGSLEGATLRLARQKLELAENKFGLFAKLFARTVEGCSLVYCAYWIISRFPV